MRTTVDIPDDLYRQVKAEAALRGARVRDLMEEGLRRVLATPSQGHESRRVSFPLIHSKQPGSMSVDAVRRAEEQSVADEDESRGRTV